MWTTVDKHQKAQMTSIIHGKYAHEEAIATASMCETYLIIKNMAEAQEVASYILDEPNPIPNLNPTPNHSHNPDPDPNPNPHQVASYILGEAGSLSDEEFMAKYKHAASAHFDPRKHLKKIGIANQTTMYKKETQAIGRLFEKVMMQEHGAENVKAHFAAFDTICDATQVRQDANP